VGYTDEIMGMVPERYTIRATWFQRQWTVHTTWLYVTSCVFHLILVL